MGEREYRLKVRVTDDKVLVSNDNGSKQAEGELGKSDATLRQVVDTLQRWLRKGDVFQSENEFEVFGHCLFEILFPTPTIRDILKSSFNQAENARQILRIELEFNENNELARLPWEYLWYPEPDMCASLRNTIPSPLIHFGSRSFRHFSKKMKLNHP